MKRTLLLLPVLFAVVISCGSGKNNKSASGKNDNPVKSGDTIVIDYPKDTVFDQIASLLSGENASSFNDTFAQSQYWKDYKISIARFNRVIIFA